MTRDWYERAGVRTGPRRRPGAGLRDELDAGRLYFPPDLVPYHDHPLVQALPARRRDELLARHLFHYLTFTAHFETRVVNRATERIAGGRGGVETGTDVRLDAYRIYCDEGYHSLYSLDVVDQISTATGIAPLPYAFDPFLRRLDATGARAFPESPVLAQLLQVVVFETLITGILSDIPPDDRVLTVVRDIVRDHARDEGWHHAFFSRFFRELWAQQSAADRARIARCAPARHVEGAACRSLAMPGAVESDDGPAAFGLKLINAATSNPGHGHERAGGVAFLFDPETARPRVLAEAGWLSAARTAAYTVVSLTHLGPRRWDAMTLVGCGTLARAHIDLAARAFPGLARLHLHDLAPPRAEALADRDRDPPTIPPPPAPASARG
ncbi:diiron oxygenase [Streptomyces specialis]|uniref:diiron oxygenase n=1 Tax=Streptomyces specialis TaxID=498367 RepID=UPI00073E3404|nr:diiron oxygenase [Streptomyces specialis]